MNNKTVENIIEFYKANFDQINKEEIYKWQAIEHFNSKWKIDKENFKSMLEDSLKLTDNLLRAAHYYPKERLVAYTEKEPETVREMFRNLFNEEISLSTRISSFKSAAIELQKKYSSEKNHQQQHMPIMVYLTLNNPEKYYFYKFGAYKEFAELIEEDLPTEGDINNILRYNYICDCVLDLVKKDEELCEMNKQRPGENKYEDNECHVLVQDIIFSAWRFIEWSKKTRSEQVDLVELEEMPQISIDKTVTLSASKTDYVKKAKENKNIGDTGEEFVLSQETKRLKELGIKKKPVRMSEKEGDGLGYDILSYDKNGNEIYIEVKTTSGNANSTFYITANELERSIKDADKFYLYRVYKYNKEKKTGKIQIKKGSLEDLCQFPTQFRVQYI